MDFRKISPSKKLSAVFLITFLLICFPVIFMTIYLYQIRLTEKQMVLLFFILIVLCFICAFVTAYLFIIRPVSNISRAASKIFESYIESSILNKDTNSAEKSFYESDDSIRLMHHVQHLMDKEYTAEMLRKQAELDALQSQINPHFLYNTLESIRGQAVYEGVETIADMAKSLSDFFRYSIQSKAPLVQLAEELHIVKFYVKIQNYRFNNKYKVDIQFDDPQLEKTGIPRLTLQPLVENAILHGLHDSLNPSELVTIKTFSTRKRLVISVSDRGCGIPEDLLEPLNHNLSQPLAANTKEVAAATSIGLNNINERIKLHYGNEYGIKLYSALHYGTTVEVSLPITEISTVD